MGHFRKVCILLLAFSFIVINNQLYSQDAPNFVVTDSDGNELKLYEDFLDQGKTVLIKVFFTTCPPCQTIAPFMEPLYQEWGAGEEDVEFIELSNKSWDTDELVNNYKDLFGITFPSVGAEGGSLDAVQPYQSGTFGQFFGTPTFVVIAPDKSVQFDVDGPGTQGTIDAIDAALAATGAMKPDEMMEEPTTISGNSSVLSSGVMLANIIVEVINPSDESIWLSDTTDLAGSVSLSFLESEIPSGAFVQARKESKPENGISAADLFLIQKHILLKDTLDGYQVLASDANNSNTVSAADLFVFQKILLDKQDQFNDGLSWIIFPSDVDILNSTGNDLTIPFSDILDGSRMLSFNGIKKGDVNSSADPAQ